MGINQQETQNQEFLQNNFVSRYVDAVKRGDFLGNIKERAFQIGAFLAYYVAESKTTNISPFDLSDIIIDFNFPDNSILAGYSKGELTKIAAQIGMIRQNKLQSLFESLKGIDESGVRAMEAALGTIGYGVDSSKFFDVHRSDYQPQSIELQFQKEIVISAEITVYAEKLRSSVNELEIVLGQVPEVRGDLMLNDFGRQGNNFENVPQKESVEFIDTSGVGVLTFGEVSEVMSKLTEEGYGQIITRIQSCTTIAEVRSVVENFDYAGKTVEITNIQLKKKNLLLRLLTRNDSPAETPKATEATRYKGVIILPTESEMSFYSKFKLKLETISNKFTSVISSIKAFISAKLTLRKEAQDKYKALIDLQTKEPQTSTQDEVDLVISTNKNARSALKYADGFFSQWNFYPDSTESYELCQAKIQVFQQAFLQRVNFDLITMTDNFRKQMSVDNQYLVIRVNTIPTKVGGLDASFTNTFTEYNVALSQTVISFIQAINKAMERF